MLLNMFRSFIALLLISLGALLQAKVTEVPLSELTASELHGDASIIVTQFMKRYHYLHKEIDDDTSAEMLDRYLESLDPNRHFFKKSDIETFDQVRFNLDNALLAGKPDIAFEIFKVFRKRVNNRIGYAISLLEMPFDFNRDESYLFDREKAPWAETDKELDDIWRKRVKNDYLGQKLADKTDKEIIKSLTKRYEGIVRRTKQLHADDVFQLFLNAYTLVVEPHTAYMSARASENFDINMKLSLQGIGAVLMSEDEYTKVQSVIAGGPAEKSGQVKADDFIIGVAQGIDGEMEDVVGWSLSDVVQQIRGDKGSIVRLAILPKGNNSVPSKEIVIIRDEIKLEDQAAKSEIIENVEGLEGLKIGVIEIPAFYRDFEGMQNNDPKARSTTRDVKELLADLQAKGVDGIVIDLRNNGGGALSEATELTGLFIEQGPIVQIRESSGHVDVKSDEDPAVYYSGPLAVLVNRNSASASEIFAGAIKDYHRGIVIGEPTFGKGTVQTLIDLGQQIRSKENLGRLRLTMAQFFRVNGGSTQHKGVVPDIVFPSAKWISDHGERSLDNALPWASIKPVPHELRDFVTVDHLVDAHKQRIANDPGFKFMEVQERLLQTIREEKVVTLNEKERKVAWEKREDTRIENRNEFRKSRGSELITKDLSDEEKDKLDEEDDEALQAVILNESARILADYIKSKSMNELQSAMTN
ncbi:MAG: carboxy terminal-processing peptidase [Gammaproteobacteria bacterium]|nr:carboxy terminal-processing peptidase [Gammaproteobacteria bacterium]NNJ90663.1 carboxy terminal-processing peptidase [Gammaproteobacteria bacterium]